MKRMLRSFQLLTLAAVILAGLPAAALAQKYEGCADWFIVSYSGGRRTFCSISGADAEYCYYDCLDG